MAEPGLGPAPSCAPERCQEVQGFLQVQRLRHTDLLYTLLTPESPNKFHSDLHKNSLRKYLSAQTQISLTETGTSAQGLISVHATVVQQ